MKKLIYSFLLIFVLGLSANTVSAATVKDKVEMTTEQKFS